ncbi:MAG: hypothetical protein PHC39_04740 [Proteiniphilum sp.]|nr:hypothetical protein [Proteiniphilum sp.]
MGIRLLPNLHRPMPNPLNLVPQGFHHKTLWSDKPPHFWGFNPLALIFRVILK